MSKRCLVVEDNAINQTVITGILQALDLAVTVAGNGVEALECVEGNSFDIIMMDLQMPLMDGLEATSRMRALGGWCATVPIIAVTANPDMLTDPHKGIAEGFTGVIPKPIDPRALAHVLLEHLPPD